MNCTRRTRDGGRCGHKAASGDCGQHPTATQAPTAMGAEAATRVAQADPMGRPSWSDVLANPAEHPADGLPDLDRAVDVAVIHRAVGMDVVVKINGGNAGVTTGGGLLIPVTRDTGYERSDGDVVFNVIVDAEKGGAFRVTRQLANRSVTTRKRTDRTLTVRSGIKPGELAGAVAAAAADRDFTT